MNSGYSAADIYAMQKEAEQRVFEMQRRARKTLELENQEENIQRAESHIQKNISEHLESNLFEPQSNNDGIEHQMIDARQNTEYQTQDDRQTEKDNKDLKGFADFLLQDKERALIVMLLLILIRENADESMILVLLYLMMEPS